MAGMLPCCYCGREVEGNYREVTGWERRRTPKATTNGRARRQGGHNALLKGARETGRHACNLCGSDLVHGVEPGTPKLFS